MPIYRVIVEEETAEDRLEIARIQAEDQATMAAIRARRDRNIRDLMPGRADAVIAILDSPDLLAEITDALYSGPSTNQH